MFEPEVYTGRRARLKALVKEGIIFIPGNTESPMNYPANTYHFRQDSNFLYFFGINLPGLSAIIDTDNNIDIIFGNDVDIDDIIWMGPQPSIRDTALKAGVMHTYPTARLTEFLNEAIAKKRSIHIAPPYRAENKIRMEKLLGIKPDDQKTAASEKLIRAIVELRSVKDRHEIAEIEKACKTGYEMHVTAMMMAKEGVRESEIAGAIEGIALSQGNGVSFPVICSIRGETLHNHYHGNILKNGDLLLTDAGAETWMNYSSDYTRTYPVGGIFTTKQKEIYETVLRANIAAINAIKPGIPYQQIHLQAAGVITEGLKAIGLMKGDTVEAVRNGAHALFFPHGLGHMMGLDVHDMEDLGENYVGYDDEIGRIQQFGTAYLRLGKRLRQGYVLTVEPGIYFIPALISQWKAERKFEEFINYDKVSDYVGFGGIRIEDDILVTEDGAKVLGPAVPKTIDEIAAVMSH